MFHTKWIMGFQEAEPCLRLRRDVFVSELNYPEEAAFDWFDEIAAHLLVFEEGDATPVAAGRMYPLPDSTRLDSICVRSDRRGQQYGDLCARLLLFKAAELEQPIISIETPEAYLAYYGGFGFAPAGPGANGKTRMLVNKKDINWDGECKKK